MRSIAIALGSFRRAPVLAGLSVVTVAFSLFAFGLFSLVAVNIRAALDDIESRVEIRAFVREGTPVDDIAGASVAVAAYPEVEKVQIVSQEDALARARAELGEFSDVFTAEFLPASLDVGLKSGFRDPVTVRNVAERIRASHPFVDDVRFGEVWITQLQRLRNISSLVGTALGLAFASVALIIIGSTIRMAVLSRAREISIMRLVGATNSFIRRPFLIEGLIIGTLGGLLALALLWGATQLLERYLGFRTVFFDPRLQLLGVALGAAMGFFGSVMSVGRQLRRV